VTDLEFQKELFELPLNGTTAIVRDSDGAYRIGRVTEIVPAGEQAGPRSALLEARVRRARTADLRGGRGRAA
jgi:hypothetical protein